MPDIDDFLSSLRPRPELQKYVRPLTTGNLTETGGEYKIFIYITLRE